MNILDMMNKLAALSHPINEAESKTTHKGGVATSDEKGTVHKGKYGNDYQGDEDDEDADKKKAKKVIKKANAPTEKRGRGRPAKGADKDGQVMKPDWSAFGAPKKDIKLKPWDKKATTKHSLKDWVENLDKALSENTGLTATPMQGATAIKNAQGQQVATATTPQAAAMMTKGEVTLNDPTKALGEEGGDLQYEMYMPNGQTKRFMAPTKEEAVKKAKACGAKSLIRLSKNYKAVGKPMRPQEMNEREDREDDEHGGGPTPGQNPDKGWEPKKVAGPGMNESQRHAKETGKKYNDQSEQFKGGKNYDSLAAKKMAADLTKKKKPAKELEEGKVSQLELDLKDTDFSDADFKKQYKKTRAEMKASMTPKKPADKKPTSKIKEEYGAQFSGNIDANDKMGRGVLGKKAKPHEDDAWESNLNNILTKRNARKDTKKPTSKIKESILRESHETMKHIINKFKHEVKNFVAGEELDNDLYEALFDYYCDMGEMPYGTAKARDGDPFEWVMNRFDRDVQNHDVPVDEAVRPENIPAVHRKQAGQNFPATLDQVGANDSRSHLPNLKAAGSKLNNDPFGFGPSTNPVQFEGWTKQLDSLLAEGMNVVANTGLGDAPDSVTVAATDEDAQQLLDLVKSAGLGMFANTNTEQSTAMSAVPADDGTAGADANIEVVDDHEDMLSLIRRMTGQGNAAPAVASEPEQQEPQESQECAGCSEGNCQTHGDQVVDETDAEPGNDEFGEKALDDDSNPFSKESDKEYQDKADARAESDSEEEAEPKEEKDEDEDEEKVDESLANEADQTFEADIDFMQNVISGGLNGKKRTQSVGNPITVAASPMKESTNLLADWKKLSGL